MLLEDIAAWLSARRQKNIGALDYSLTLRRRLLSYVVAIVGFVAFYIFITPATWSDPIRVFIDTLSRFSSYDSWAGTMQFMGEMIRKPQMPWYFLPVWWLFTVPFIYLALMVVGIVFLVVRSFRPSPEGILTNRYIWLLFGFWFLPTAMVIIKPSTIYTEWRHVYFLFPLMVFLAVYGLQRLTAALAGSRFARLRFVAPVLLGASLLWQAVWMVCTHPHQNVYFNTLGRHYASGMTRDSWKLCYKQMVEYILSNDPDDVNIFLPDSINEIQMVFFKDQAHRLRFLEGEKNLEKADYIIYSFRNTVGNNYEVGGFEEIYAIWVDGFKIGTILQRVT